MTVGAAFLKAYKNLVEKPGNAEHSAKFDACVAHVQEQGNGKNAYAICSAAMGDESFKSMEPNNPNFIKEIDFFLQKLGIGGAGPVPNSLLAEQDLEGRSEKSFSKTDYMKKETIKKAGDKCYVIRCNGNEWGRYGVKKEAEEALAYLTNQGTYAVLIEESVVSSTEKGAVETTGKQLEQVTEAAKAEDADSETLIDRMKNIQQKRQKATIAERSKTMKGQDFKSVWGGLNGKK